MTIYTGSIVRISEQCFPNKTAKCCGATVATSFCPHCGRKSRMEKDYSSLGDLEDTHISRQGDKLIYRVEAQRYSSFDSNEPVCDVIATGLSAEENLQIPFVKDLLALGGQYMHQAIVIDWD